MRISAGFLIKSRGLYLICHSTNGNKPSSLYDGRWGVPKGMRDEGETTLETALRETKEEIGVDLNQHYPIYPTIEPIFSYVGYRKKNVIIFFLDDVEGTIYNSQLVCDSLIDDTDLPEIDEHLWVPKNLAVELTNNNNGQRDLFSLPELS